MNSRIIIILCINIFSFLITQYGYCSDYNENNKKAITSGFKLVESFYSCLTFESNQDKCDKLFNSYPNSKNYDTKSIWNYIRNNKNIFVLPRENHKDAEFFKRSRKTVSFYNIRNLDNMFDDFGLLYITVSSNLSGDKFYSGIYKEIAFPVIKDELSNEYRIQLGNIKVNGIIIDFNNEFKRDFDIIEYLGFKPELKSKTIQK